jgi:GT2 family glycosyltransferase
MNPHTRKHHLITVHYGDPQATINLVTTLQQGKQAPDTITVINHDKHSLSKLASRNCYIITPAKNQGYAAGINTGLGTLITRGAKINDIITCINNDITIKSKTFLSVRRWWEDHPEPALVGFATDQNNDRHIYGYINLLTGRSRLSASPAVRIKAQTQYIHGAFMSAPLSVFIDNQGLPEKYFMYWEDILFSRQVEKKNISLKVVPITTAKHQVTNTENTTSDNKLYYLVRNGALFLEQETSLPWRAYWTVLNRARYVYHTLNGPQKPTVAEAIKDAIHGVTGSRNRDK